MINIFMTQYNSSNKSWNFTIDNISSYNNSDITFNNDLSLNCKINSVYVKSNVTNFTNSMAIVNHNLSNVSYATNNTFFWI